MSDSVGRVFTREELARAEAQAVRDEVRALETAVAARRGRDAEQARADAEQSARVSSVLDRVHFVRSEWEEHVHFSEHNYTRMLLSLNEHFSLVLICWMPSQDCPKHSHDHAPPGRTP